MAGETIAFSQADLAATAAAFNPALGKAPIVIGHPATDDPAMGWVERLEANERGLFAYPKQVDPAFAESARAGRFGALSAMFYRPTDAGNPKPGVWYLKHVGALGAQQPAVKGLDDPAFAASATGVCFAEGVAFGAWEERTQASLWRSLREFLLTKFGREEADAAIPTYEVQSLEQAAEAELNRPVQTATATTVAPAFSEPALSVLETHPMPPTPEQLAQLAQLEALEAENKRMKAQLAQAETAKRHAANVAFCESIGANKLLPAWRGVAVATLDAFDAAPAPVQFGEGEAQAPLADKFKAFLQALPEAVAFGEHATPAAAAPRTEANPLLADAAARAAPEPR